MKRSHLDVRAFLRKILLKGHGYQLAVLAGCTIPVLCDVAYGSVTPSPRLLRELGQQA